MTNEHENIIKLWDSAKAVRAEKVPLWEKISAHVGITVNVKYLDDGSNYDKAKQREEYVEDPTAALSVMQAGDYLDGIIWGTGDGALTLEPSDRVSEKADDNETKDYFNFRTKQLLNNMNHSSAGFATARKPYMYDQIGFGTSGIGVFKNAEYPRSEENPYFFRQYGVDNMAIDEGKNGRVEVIFPVYSWRVSRIIQEFEGYEDQLPKEIQDCIKGGDYSKTFTLVQAIYPRAEFQFGKKGKMGTRYKSAWFMDKDKANVFFEEDFRRLPIGVCRAIKVRGSVWGESSGSILISSIMSVNYMVSQVIESVEKMNEPNLTVVSGALFGDSVLDLSAGEANVINPAVTGSGKTPPIFPTYNVGDPTALVSFLVPYLNEKIATGFKVDLLLDFASTSGATATEIIKKDIIRAKGLSGILGQQKSEMLDIVVDRSLQLEDDMGLGGVNASNTTLVKEKKDANKSEMVIPQAVQEAMDAGKRWYKVKYNNELERMTRTEALERIMQMLNGITAIMSVYPQIVDAIEWYDLLKDINEYLGFDYLKSKDEFVAGLQKQAEIQEKAMLLQAGQAGADIQSKLSKSNKDESDAER